MILNKPQAEAVYSAMCAINNVAAGDGFRLRFIGTVNRVSERIEVAETDKDVIRVTAGAEMEHYAGQAAFAAAYGIQ